MMNLIQGGLIVALLLAGGTLLLFSRPLKEISGPRTGKIRWAGAAIVIMTAGLCIMMLIQITGEAVHSIGH